MAYHAIATIFADVLALNKLVEQFTLDNLGGCNDSPAMVRLVDQLVEFINSTEDDRHFIRHMPSHFKQIELATCLSGEPLEAVTCLDLFHMGLLASCSEWEFTQILDDLTLRRIPLYTEEAHRKFCACAMRKAINSGSFGPIATSERYDDLRSTGYSVPPKSSSDAIDAAYIRMASDALFQFDMLVLQHVHFVEGVANYLTSDEDAD